MYNLLTFNRVHYEWDNISSNKIHLLSQSLYFTFFNSSSVVLLVHCVYIGHPVYISIFLYTLYLRYLFYSNYYVGIYAKYTCP